jgi:hypothetical protein
MARLHIARRLPEDVAWEEQIGLQTPEKTALASSAALKQSNSFIFHEEGCLAILKRGKVFLQTRTTPLRLAARRLFRNSS